VALHEQSVGATNNWFTPPHVFEAQGCEFDVDVASPGREVTPWIPAAKFITERSLEVEWPGFCWMNAPFGPRMGLVPWLGNLSGTATASRSFPIGHPHPGGSGSCRAPNSCCSSRRKFGSSVPMGKRADPRRKGRVSIASGRADTRHWNVQRATGWAY
jgi:hypothetical protein